MPTLTVFTPTYNRAHTLPRTYESLCLQDCKDFVWLIVDDGSSDDTAEIVHNWQKEYSGFEIRYIYKENGGMHTAHNVAYDHIDSEINVCIDSDDCLAIGAVRKILEKWRAVRNFGYAGLIGLDADLDGNLIGKGFPKEMFDTTLAGYYAAGGSGDKKLVYRTDVIKQYPSYPVFKDEKYVALAYKYRLIDQDFKLAIINEVLCNVEYQIDGHGAGMWKEYLRSPKGFAFYRAVCMQYPETSKRLVIDCVHYCSHSLIARNIHYIKESPCKLLTVACTIPGAVLAMITKKKAQKG